MSDDDLFGVLSDDLKVTCNEGELTLPQLKKLHGTIYIKTEETHGFEDLMLRAQKIPVVYGYYFAALSYCQKYADAHDVTVITLGTEDSSKQLLPTLTGQDALKDRLSSSLLKPGRGGGDE